MTAQAIVARIQQQLASQGIAWREGGRDTFKAGKPDASVRGIATTGMSTFDVLRRAAAAGKNFVITHEPTFYNDRDVTTTLESDPVYLAKQRFIADKDLVVWRFHDHAHLMRPDPLVAGSARALGWTPYVSPENPRIYVLPATTLGALAAAVARRLGDRALRVVGDPAMPVTRVVLGPGYGIPALTSAVDVAIGGEISESGGNAEYALDAAAAGHPKAMIVLGHMMSEDHGMQEVADWLRTFLSDVPIAFIPAGEPSELGLRPLPRAGPLIRPGLQIVGKVLRSVMDREYVGLEVIDDSINDSVRRLNDLSYRRIREFRNGAT